MGVRHQPFFDESTIKLSAIEEYEVPEHENPPIITPQFYHEGQFVMDPTRFTVDCEKYGDRVNVDNKELVNEMMAKYEATGLVYLRNTKLTQLKDMRKLIGVIIPDELNMEYKGGSNWRNHIEPNVY